MAPPVDRPDATHQSIWTYRDPESHEKHRLSQFAHHKDWPSHRKVLDEVLSSPYFDSVIGVLLIVNIVLVVVETDVQRITGAAPGLRVALRCFLGIYVLEIAARIYVKRCVYFQQKGSMVDLAIVVIDVASELLQSTNGHVPSVSLLRIFRLLRLVRVVRTIRGLRELAFILQGLQGAMKALLSAGVLLFLLLTFWSIVAVEVLTPLTQRVDFPDCPRCPRAFRTVMDANLTFSQIIIAGDAWGEIAIPMIEKFPWTAIIFLGALLSVDLVVMNLILSVIVDQAVEAREEDVTIKLKDKQEKFKKAARELYQVCSQMDTDHNGRLTLDEFLEGYDNNSTFAEIINLMDVKKEDLCVVFRMMDSSDKGEVPYRDFVENLHKVKTQDSHTILMFIKFYLGEVRRDVKEELNLLKNTFEKTHQRYEELIIGSQAAEPLDQPNLYDEYKDHLNGAHQRPVESNEDQQVVGKISNYMLEPHQLEYRLDCIRRRMDADFEAMIKEVKYGAEPIKNNMFRRPPGNCPEPSENKRSYRLPSPLRQTSSEGEFSAFFSTELKDTEDPYTDEEHLSQLSRSVMQSSSANLQEGVVQVF